LHFLKTLTLILVHQCQMSEYLVAIGVTIQHQRVAISVKRFDRFGKHLNLKIETKEDCD